MTRASPNYDPGGERGIGLRSVRHSSGVAAAALFLFLSPTVAWPQTAAPDQQSGAAPAQGAQQSGSTEDSATQLAAATDPKSQASLAAPSPEVIPVEPKPQSPAGKQTKRMFWIIPNFAAVSDCRLRLLDDQPTEAFYLGRSSCHHNHFVRQFSDHCSRTARRNKRRNCV